MDAFLLSSTFLLVGRVAPGEGVGIDCLAESHI